jgi:hypothetical protein
MTDQLVARLLEDSAQIDQLFPVANLASGVSLDRWRSFASEWLERPEAGRGILVVQDPSGYVLALCSFQATEDLQRGSVLSVENLIAVDLISGERIAGVMLENLEGYARARGLSGLQIHTGRDATVDPASSALADALGEQGYRMGAVRWVKNIDRRRQAGRAPRPIVPR